MNRPANRREFLQTLGVGAAALPFLTNLSSLRADEPARRKQRLIVMFSPNGVLPERFWNDKEGPLEKFNDILQPLEPYRDRTLLLHGVSDKLQGDGDRHMRGIGCLLTGIELFPGNIQGGSDTPAGWSSGHSVDQEIARFLQADPANRTRFGSLELGVAVPDKADTWTRMVYTGPNQPIAPVDDPYQLFAKMYGQMKDRESLASVLDVVTQDLATLKLKVGAEDRDLIEQHESFVRDMEKDLKESAKAEDVGHAVPDLPPGIEAENDQMPQISKMQIDLLVGAMKADFARVATLQYTNSVGQARMKWLGIDDSHHSLSHEPDDNKDSQEKLTKINRWYCEQLLYLVDQLAQTPEPGGAGSMLDNTVVVWTNELGKGNAHWLEKIPFVLVGGGMDFRTGRQVNYDDVPHNRLLLSLAHGFGHRIDTFGNPQWCADGPLDRLT